MAIPGSSRVSAPIVTPLSIAKAGGSNAAVTAAAPAEVAIVLALGVAPMPAPAAAPVLAPAAAPGAPRAAAVKAASTLNNIFRNEIAAPVDDGEDYEDDREDKGVKDDGEGEGVIDNDPDA